MRIDDVKKVCVIGGGLMGRQIALNSAVFGYEVRLCDASDEVLGKVRVWLDEYLAGRIAKGKMTKEQTEEYKGRMRIAPSLEEAIKDVQLVIEAVVEIRDVKFDLFRKLNKLVPANTILTTNSSTMVSSMFKDLVDNPSRLANLHYFNPALVMKLIEIVQGDHTSDETAELLMEFAKRTGKIPIRLTKECEGFVVNRALGALKAECLKIVEEGICTPQEVDTGLELGLNHPMGVFRLNDLTGIDLYFHLLEQMYKDRGIKPAGYDLYKGMVERGELGQKTGKGFYSYKKS
ncbi:MAG: 3-hydroxyacyl-CoA dehydrogenase family protein [Spirochaetaceae bacterium]|jgi:3-hydroxybutyryl-CoA dehydrogenase|nr:3-hydroxyacyl-CoA dehydrogenase family protein [Spirochaetaceae bacterium]